LQQGQQLPLQQQQRCLHINGNNAIVTRATTPSQWWQGPLHIDDDNDVIAIRATTPAWGQQQGHQDEGNNTDQGQQHHFLQGQQCHLDNSKDACPLTMATTQLSQGGQAQLQ
jgi:hypothetical protein